MPTPSIQTLVTDAQQVLNLDSISAVRSVVAVALANANTGTPLNPNLTTQQLWNEFYQVVNKPKSDIESIIANQLMKFLFAPPAPGGAGADQQVIFNDGGVLAGDPQFLWNKTTNLLTVTGSATITGDLTVRTNKLAVTSTGVGCGTATPGTSLEVWKDLIRVTSDVTSGVYGTQFWRSGVERGRYGFDFSASLLELQADGDIRFLTGGENERFRIDSSGNVGVGVSPGTRFSVYSGTAGSQADFGSLFRALISTGTNRGTFGSNCSESSSGVFYAQNNTAASSVDFASDGSIQFYSNSGLTAGNSFARTEQMRLNSTGLGVGMSPSSGKIAARAGTSATGNSIYLDNLDGTYNPWFQIQHSSSGIKIFNSSSFGGASNNLIFGNGTTSETMRIDASGNLLVGTTSGSLHKFQKAIAVATGLFEISSSSTGSRSLLAYSADAEGWSANTPAIFIGKYSVTGRSINAGGTINASGADYAEYMVKCGDFVLAKGDVAGIDANGKLTNVFADAVSFVVKSTEPSYVGNDKWGVDLEGDALEAARQLVDRIAFSGQVPVNVTGAKSGDYIVPVVNGTGIKGISVSNPTFEQYKLAVGKVITIDADGRARIIVKVA